MAKDLDTLEVIFYAWKLHTDKSRVLSAVQQRCWQAARLYRSRACFLALAVYAQERSQKAALYQRLYRARNVQTAKLVMRNWRALTRSQRNINSQRQATLARRKAVRVISGWRALTNSDYSSWVNGLNDTQLQHLKKVSYFWYLHLFRRFSEACRTAARSRFVRLQSANFYSERLRLKALLSIRLWIKQRLEQQNLACRAYEHYQWTLRSKVFAALADSAFLAYTARLVLGCWRAQAKLHATLRKYLRECGLCTLEVASTTARTSKTGSDGNVSFGLEGGCELTIE
jgi:hypothetical protein